MDRAIEFLAPLRTFDPARWVMFAQEVPVLVAVVMFLGGIAAALFGAGRYFRAVAGPMGALVGILGGPALGQLVRVGPENGALGATLLFGAGGAAYPPAVIFLVSGTLFGLFGGGIAGSDDFWLGFIPGFVLGGTAAVIGKHVIEVVLASLFGSILMVWGLMRIAGLAASLAPYPQIPLGVAGIAGLAGIVFQLKVRRSPEEAEKARARKVFEQQKVRDDEERMKRLLSYSSKARQAKEGDDE